MKIEETKYKDIFAIKLVTSRYVAIVLPSEGGKIASFKTIENSREYLVQNPSERFLHLGRDNDFVENECAGFDDMFPTIDETQVKSGQRKGLTYRDHGNVCRLKFDYAIKKNKLQLFVKDDELKYSYTKVFSEKQDGSLKVKYYIRNEIKDDFNALWSAHCLVDVSNGGKIISPIKKGELVDLVSDLNQTVGKKCQVIEYDEKLFTMPKTQAEKACYKIYSPSIHKQRELGVLYETGERFTLKYSKKLKYIGLWYNDGYFKNYRCFGLEPCTLGYDTIYNAEKYGFFSKIKGKRKLKFFIELLVKKEIKYEKTN